MHDDATRARRAREFADRVQRADFVIGEHDRDEHRIGAQRGNERIDIEPARRVDAEHGRLESVVAQRLDGREHRAMFGRYRDDVRAATRAACGARRPRDRQTGRLRTAAREDDFARPRPERTRERAARAVERRARRAPLGVQRTRVVAARAQVRRHRGDRLGAHGRRRRVVEEEAPAVHKRSASLARRASIHGRSRASSPCVPGTKYARSRKFSGKYGSSRSAGGRSPSAPANA